MFKKFNQKMMNIFLIISIICLILVDKVKTAYILGWMVQNQFNPNTGEQLKMNNMVPIYLQPPDNNLRANQFENQIDNQNEDNSTEIRDHDKNSDLLSVGLSNEDKLRCRSNLDCLSVNKEMYCGKFDFEFRTL